MEKTAPAPVAGDPESGEGLSSDRFVRFGCALFVLLSLPYFIPIFDTSQLWYYGAYFLDLPLLAFLQAVFVINFRKAEEKSERRFWGWLIFGFSLWAVESASQIALINRTDWTTLRDLFSYFLYFGWYASVVMAIENRPHLKSDRPHNLLLFFDRVGALVFLFGLLLYLTVLPALVDWESYWTSTLILFVILDAFIFLRILAFRRTVADGPWRSIYSWLLVAAALCFSTDLTEVLMWAGVVPYIGSGTAFDIVWIVGFPVFVIAARSGRHTKAAVSPQSSSPSGTTWEVLGMGPIVVYAVAMPLFHLLFHRFGWADPGLKSPRELLTVVFALILTTMAFAYQVWLRGENKRLSKQRLDALSRLEHQAFHDALTGLPNRRLFREHLAQGIARARRYQNLCAVFFCDLDEFKVINDSLGHRIGDQFLIAISRRLRDSIRASDTVARFGGDEFAVLVHDIESELKVLPVAEHLIAAIRAPITLGDREHVFTASIGIALYPEDGTDEATLLKHADIAMYQAKLKGRDSYQLFAPSMNEAAEKRLLIERGLREAIDLGTLKLHYQPIIDLETRDFVGCEALLRWIHPEDGLVGPDLFIEVAEQTGLIVPIGEWVLETACEWRQQLDVPGAPDFVIAVNISAHQLQHPSFATRVKEILGQTGLPPSRLQLELTESMAIERVHTSAVIAELRDLGITIAIDDLGTGFSGLSRLCDLPIDVVKIDRSFIGGAHENPAGEAIVQAVVGMARSLDLHVTAEGVETEEQLELVQQHGCDSAQGFLFHRPMEAEDIERILSRLTDCAPCRIRR